VKHELDNFLGSISDLAIFIYLASKIQIWLAGFDAFLHWQSTSGEHPRLRDYLSAAIAGLAWRLTYEWSSVSSAMRIFCPHSGPLQPIPPVKDVSYRDVYNQIQNFEVLVHQTI